MDWYPLWNSLRIALISCAAVFFLGIFAAYYIAKLPRTVKGVLDVILCLLYTSDAADEEDRENLGGPRIIKKQHCIPNKERPRIAERSSHGKTRQ